MIGATAVGAVVAGRGRQRSPSVTWLVGAARSIGAGRRRPLFAAGVAAWTLLILAVIGWDLNSFVHQAHDLPTLSYLFGRVTRWTWGRALVFAAWLSAGAGLVVACRTVRRQEGREG